MPKAVQLLDNRNKPSYLKPLKFVCIVSYCSIASSTLVQLIGEEPPCQGTIWNASADVCIRKKWNGNIGSDEGQISDRVGEKQGNRQHFFDWPVLCECLTFGDIITYPTL